jgi:hypothetical protein
VAVPIHRPRTVDEKWANICARLVYDILRPKASHGDGSAISVHSTVLRNPTPEPSLASENGARPPYTSPIYFRDTALWDGWHLLLILRCDIDVARLFHR